MSCKGKVFVTGAHHISPSIPVTEVEKEKGKGERLEATF